MISEQDLKNSVNMHIANLLAEQVYRRLKKDLQTQYDTVINEMVNARRTIELIKRELATSQNQSIRLEKLLNQKETELQSLRETQKKSAQILDEALKSLGVGE